MCTFNRDNAFNIRNDQIKLSAISFSREHCNYFTVLLGLLAYVLIYTKYGALLVLIMFKC